MTLTLTGFGRIQAINVGTPAAMSITGNLGRQGCSISIERYTGSYVRLVTTISTRCAGATELERGCDSGTQVRRGPLAGIVGMAGNMEAIKTMPSYSNISEADGLGRFMTRTFGK
jgi:hypothetical protein